MRPVDSASIVELLTPYAALRPAQVGQVSIYLDLLLKWNARINLTAVRDAREMITRHFGESFFAAEWLLEANTAVTVADVGSGAGFPGLPLAIIAPGARVTLIESNGKKAAFLNEVISALRLGNAKVFSQRAESYSGADDLVTMRAVEKFSRALPLALRLVRPGGRIALMIGASQYEEAKTLVPEVYWQEPVSVPGGHSRVLVVGAKKTPLGE